MADSLDVLVETGKNDFQWIGFVRTYDEAVGVIRKHGKTGLFLVHSQGTGRKTYFRAESEDQVVQLIGPPPEYLV
jgi:hypothetical protein